MASGHHWVVPAPGQPPYYSYGVAQPPAAEPFRYLPVLRRHKLLIILTLAALTLAGAGWTWLQTPVYRAQTIVEIEGNTGNFVFAKDPESSPLSGFSQESYMDTQTRLFQSATLAEHVAEKLRLAERPELQRQSRLATLLHLGHRPRKITTQQAGRRVLNSISVAPEGQSRLVKISVDWPDPQMAATIANALVTEYAQGALESRWKTASQTTDWLTKQLEDFRRKLQQSEQELQAYANANGLLFTDEKNSVAEDKLRQLQQSLSSAQADRAEKQSLMQVASGNDADALPRVLEDRPLQEMQAKLNDLKRQLAELSAIYGPANSQIRRLKPQIAETEAAVARERGNVLQRVRNDYRAAAEREQLLRSQYSQQARLVADQSTKAIRYNILRRDVETNRQLYDSMLQRVRESSVASALRATSARTVDPAHAPSAPYRPSLPLNMALGFLAGSACSVLLVLFRERTDMRLRMPGETAVHTRVPELGVIPSIALERTGWRRGAARGAGEPWRNTDALAAESFRFAVTSLLFSSTSGRRPQLVVITSASPGEGKSTAAANLAVSLARARKRVLLVDGDLRNPRLHQSFHLPNDNGLSESLLSGESDAPYQQTQVEGLFLLAAGPVMPAAPDLLHSDRLASMLDRWRQEFDTILVDTPPALMFLDARVFARMSDGVVLVCRAHKTSVSELMTVKDRLVQDGSTVLGTILNDLDPKSAGRSYYYRHHSARQRGYAA